MNFAEQLTYWYLRLNGFIPLTNFVLHHNADHRTSDADLLAVRFPHVSEDIGGNPADWDPRMQEDWEIDLAAETIGLVVEVKSGHWDREGIIDPVREWRVREGLKRIGMLPADRVDVAVNQLRRCKVTRVDGYTVGKLLVTDDHAAHELPWIHMSLGDLEEFIRRRMETFRQRKLADRLFFDGDLIQYLAWKGDERGR